MQRGEGAVCSQSEMLLSNRDGRQGGEMNVI